MKDAISQLDAGGPQDPATKSVHTLSDKSRKQDAKSITPGIFNAAVGVNR